MKYERILEKAKKYNGYIAGIDAHIVNKWEESFAVGYTHESTAIEGNTLSLMETKVVLEDGIAIGGKQLREIYEVINHHKAYLFIQKKIAEQLPLSEATVKDIHCILMENIFQGGFYRNVNVRITGASHFPPDPEVAYRAIQNFFADMPLRSKEDPITFAAWTHAEFVRIHPFIDGNGRTCRLMMNYQLLSHKLLPVSIPKTARLEYFKYLEEYALTGKIEPFADYLALLEEKRLDDALKNFE